MFRFDYSTEFLKWALNPPGQYPEWLPVVKLKKN
jgi:glycylpeptide N-tetradecanoyltransferase